MFFKFRESFRVHTIAPGDVIATDVMDMVMGVNIPTPKIISLDAEKALIQSMQPKYNKEYYKNYPVSKDGLYRYNLDRYSFQIHSPIILEYSNGEIVGMPEYFKPDSIVVSKGQPLTIIKNQDRRY